MTRVIICIACSDHFLILKTVAKYLIHFLNHQIPFSYIEILYEQVYFLSFGLFIYRQFGMMLILMGQ
jgi:hypothetical protein